MSVTSAIVRVQDCGDGITSFRVAQLRETHLHALGAELHQEGLARGEPRERQRDGSLLARREWRAQVGKVGSGNGGTAYGEHHVLGLELHRRRPTIGDDEHELGLPASLASG